MARLSPVLVTACVLGLAGTGRAGAEEDPTGALYADVRDLAAWCRAEGLVSEARRAYAYALSGTESTPDHPLRRSAEAGLRALPPGPAPRATAAQRAVYRARVRRLVGEAALRYVRRAEALRAAGDAAGADKAIETALAVHEDCAPARRLRGEERLEGLGWMPSAEASRLAANRLNLARLPPPAQARLQDPLHRRWSDAWVLETPHYVIRSNRPLAEVAAAARLCEKLYAAFFEMSRGVCDRPSERMGMLYLADEDDYRRFLADVDKKGWMSPHNVSGFYDHQRRLCVVWARRPPAETPGAVPPDAGTLLHEGVHQLLHLGYGGSLPTRLPFAQPAGNEQVHFWLVEGVAGLFESMELAGHRLVLSRDGPRYRNVAQRLADGWRPDLTRWMSMGQKRFLADGAAGHYDLAATFAYFLVNCAEGKKYRDRFFRLVSAYYGGDVGLDTFQEIFQTRIDHIQGEFEAYVRQTWPIASR